MPVFPVSSPNNRAPANSEAPFLPSWTDLPLAPWFLAISETTTQAHRTLLQMTL